VKLSNKIGKFAFIIHPLSLKDIYRLDPSLERKDPLVVKRIMLQWVPPLLVEEVEFTSRQGQVVRGLIICLTILPEFFVSLSNGEAKMVFNKLEQAAKLAEAAEVSLIGLGALTAVIGGNGRHLAERLGIGVTTGNSYTVAVAVHSVRAIAEKRHLDLKKAKLTVVGATGSIGKACVRLLAREVGQLTLVAKNVSVLLKLQQEIYAQENRNVTIETDVKPALAGSDIIILTTSDATLKIDKTALKPEAVVLNLSQPPNVDFNGHGEADGPLVIDGGKVIPPPQSVLKKFVPRFPYVPGIDSDEIFSCYAETIILAMAQRTQDFSIGRDLTREQVEEISSLATHHGFVLPDFRI
jgi:fatty aldehyde-generating acyl-ACP reductase